jgi:hypothetical protein
VRVTATVVTMATPRAAPIWKEVLLRPETSPDSCSGTPARAAIEAVMKASPRDRLNRLSNVPERLGADDLLRTLRPVR